MNPAAIPLLMQRSEREDDVPLLLASKAVRKASSSNGSGGMFLVAPPAPSADHHFDIASIIQRMDDAYGKTNWKYAMIFEVAEESMLQSELDNKQKGLPYSAWTAHIALDNTSSHLVNPTYSRLYIQQIYGITSTPTKPYDLRNPNWKENDQQQQYRSSR